MLAGVAFPHALESVAALVGVAVPINLVFFLGMLLLLVVVVQLSSEVGGLERETQTLAEEVALLRNRLEHVERAAGLRVPGPGVDMGDPPDAPAE